MPTSLEVPPSLEEPQEIRPAESREAVPVEKAPELEDDPLTKLLSAAERERGLPYTFRIPISMDREFRTLAKEFDLDLSDIARSGLEMALVKLRQMSRARKRRLQ